MGDEFGEMKDQDEFIKPVESGKAPVWSERTPVASRVILGMKLKQSCCIALLNFEILL